MANDEIVGTWQAPGLIEQAIIQIGSGGSGRIGGIGNDGEFSIFANVRCKKRDGVYTLKLDYDSGGLFVDMTLCVRRLTADRMVIPYGNGDVEYIRQR
jgi:hypothetical protein